MRQSLIISAQVYPGLLQKKIDLSGKILEFFTINQTSITIDVAQY